MATLVLTTVGSLIGGPIGGAIGAALGSQIDRRWLAPKRTGPRLGDLSVQTSSYGTALPRLFGTMRMAGTVIWATDLREDAHHSGGSKGGGASTTYSYSASFAVALSARPIRSVGRIWADGKLLRGGAGDWKSQVGAFRLHPGDEDQPADPLIASAEGLAATPAHRGLAYAVFDTLQLADFGNRIPSLTFEVTADDGAVDIGAIVSDLAEGAVTGLIGADVGGFAASGDSKRGAIEALAAAYPLPLADDGETLSISSNAIADVTIDDLGARADEGRGSRLERDRRAASALPDEVAVAYYEPGRDFQAGLQRARRDGIGARGERIDLPAAIGADAAKGLAEAVLARRWDGRERATVRLPWRHMAVKAGTLMRLDGAVWRVANWTLERMALELSLEREGPALLPVPATPGRVTAGPDRLAGTTRLHLLDLPAIDGLAATSPRLWLAAAGTQAGWRRAAASVTLDGGASWRALGDTAPAAVIGATVDAVPAGTTMLFDRIDRIDVDVLHDAMTLPSGGDAALVAGRNLALVGDELIGFGHAEQIGPRRWRLSGLLRGRFGTEWAMPSHRAGDRFVLIEAGRLLPIDLPLSALGGRAGVMAAGLGDGAVAATAETDVIGRALRPPAPVSVSCRRLEDGALRIDWIRRSRSGWAWVDGIDLPSDEDGERYRLTLTAGATTRTVETLAPSFDYAVDAQAEDGLAETLRVAIEQIGRFGPSLPPATFIFTI